MGYIDPRIRATTRAQEEILDIIARREDLTIEVMEGNPSGVRIRGKGISCWRRCLAEVDIDDLYAVPMPPGWDR